MKAIKYMFVIAVIISMSGKVFGQETVRGTIQYKSDSQSVPGVAGLIMATAVIPAPAQGVPNQIKAIITKKVSQENEKKAARFVFILPVEKQKTGASFSVQNGNIVAAIGAMDPEKEQVALYLVYRSATKDGKAAFSQVKVEIGQ